MAIDLHTPKPSATTASFWQADLNLGGHKVSSKERLFFTERLALLLDTGNVLHSCLTELASQTDNRTFRDNLEQIGEDVLHGRQFSQALARHPAAFPLTYVNLVAAGEQGGFMVEVLEQLHAMEEKRQKLYSDLVSAVSYPAFLIVFSLAVVIFILTFVFPKFGSLFESIREHLPITTIVLMETSTVLKRYWYLLLAGGGALLMALRFWLSSGEGRRVVDRMKVSLPLVKDIFAQIYLVQTFRVLSLSLTHGVSILDALNSCRDITDNSVFRDFIVQLEVNVAEGHGFAMGFESGSFIPPMARQMIRTGDASGNLAKVMARMADFYERELDRRVTFASKIVEPVMLLLMGLVVGLLVSSLILPIFKLSKAVH